MTTLDRPTVGLAAAVLGLGGFITGVVTIWVTVSTQAGALLLALAGLLVFLVGLRYIALADGGADA